MDKFIEYGSSRICFTDRGNGAPIVLLHGYLESKEIWGEFANRLSKDSRVVSIDLPGHGKSGMLNDIHEMSLIADAVKAVVKSLALEKIMLVGHSMGGYATMAFVDQFSDLLAGFCLFHSSPFADTPEKQLNRDRQTEVVREGKKSQLLKSHFPMTFAADNVSHFSTEIEVAEQIANQMSDVAIIAALQGMKMRRNYSDVLASSSIPFLYILGLKDNFIPESILHSITMPSESHLCTLKNSGHMGFLEEEQTALDSVLLFYKQCFGVD